MGHILLGHGALNVHPSVIKPEMEWVAVPAGTTIQFYADTGQGLGDLVIVDLGDEEAGQPYVSWIKSQNGVASGQETTTAKGHAFSAGELTASGVGDRALFQGAIRRSSKKKISYT
jgi:hypothetical protein